MGNWGTMLSNPYWWGISSNSMLEHVNVVHWIYLYFVLGIDKGLFNI